MSEYKRPMTLRECVDAESAPTIEREVSAPTEKGEPVTVSLGHDGKCWPDTMDGMVWAQEFHNRFQIVAVDDALGWFCNAIMRGYDEANWRRDAAPISCASCGEKDAKIARLTKERDELQFSWSGCSQQLKDACEDLTQAEAIVAQQAEEIARLKEDRETLVHTYNQAFDAMQGQQEAIDKQANQIKSLTAENTIHASMRLSQVKQLLQQAERIKELESSSRKWRDTYENKLSQWDQSQKQLAAATASLASKDALIERSVGVVNLCIDGLRDADSDSSAANRAHSAANSFLAAIDAAKGNQHQKEKG